MSEIANRQRRDRRAGVVILILAAFGLWLIFLANEARARPAELVEYNVIFKVAKGVNGVVPGSQIFYGGMQVGRVEKVTYRDGELVVTTLVSPQYRLHPGATITRQASPLGGKASFVIESTGDHSMAKLPEGSDIDAAEGPDGVSAVLGEANADRVTRIRDGISATVEGLGRINAQVAGLGDAADRIRAFGDVLDSDIEHWRPVVERLDERFERIEPKFAGVRSELEGVIAAGEPVRTGLLELSERFSGPEFESLRSGLAATGSDFDALAKTFEGDLVPRTRELVSRLESAGEDAGTLLDQLEATIATLRRSFQIFIANSTLTSQELVLARSEIISKLGLPLLERPSRAEIELLTRERALEAWASTANRIQLLLGAINSLEVDDGEHDPFRSTFKRLREELERTLEAYEGAQSTFFDQPPAP